MIHRIGLALMGWVSCAEAAEWGDRIPWVEGETLRYEITWGPLVAAEATYTARKIPGLGSWEFAFDLKTQGTTHKIYPIEARGISQQQVRPWRSLQVEDRRTQAGQSRDVLSVMDYVKKVVKQTDRRTGETSWIPDLGTALQDLVSLPYGWRTLVWKEGEKKIVRVCLEKKIQPVEISCLARENRLDPGRPARPCVVLWVRPLDEDPQKMAAGYGAKVWLSEEGDRQVPIRAEMKLKFGTVVVRLIELEESPK
jgi:hypothetical protein